MSERERESCRDGRPRPSGRAELDFCLHYLTPHQKQNSREAILPAATIKGLLLIAPYFLPAASISGRNARTETPSVPPENPSM